ncbi:FadR/GntR family transcriptional regulator (plasmid) [Microvirga sp. RSM25]|uniref:FadR/GntR family transcriptional regulator n=1 Tax=Microvirga sp. RSM25 TaxID=3273802 RepID=UPI00384D5A13
MSEVSGGRRQKSEKPDASADVVDRINAMIRSGALSPGDRLPSEIRFAEQLGVSRSAVTKAYAKLEAFGLIRTVPQSGTFLAGIGGDALTALLSNVMDTDFIAIDTEDINSVYQFRAFVEEMLAATVAETADDAAIQRLEAKAAEVKHRILDGKGTIEDDLLFHLELAELSGRPFFKALLLFITLPMVQVFRRFEKGQRTTRVRERWRRSMAEHDAIVAAIKSRDVEATKEAVRTHFQNAMEFRTDMMASPGTSKK